MVRGRLGALGAAAIWVWGLSAGVAGAAGACQFLQIGEIPAKFEHNQPLLEASINGQKVWLLVDTGSSTSLLFEGAAQRLGLHPVMADRVRLYGVGGVQAAKRVTIAAYGLGGAVAHNIPLLVAGGRLGGDAAGVIGRDFLSQADVEFDLAHGAIRLFKPRNCGAQDGLAYWSKTFSMTEMSHAWTRQNAIELPVLLNGRRVDAILDSGAMTSVITPGAAQSAGVGSKQLEADSLAQSRGLGPAAVPSRTAMFDKLEIGDEAVSHVKLRVADLFRDDKEVEIGSHVPTPVAQLPSMLLGADFLRAHRVLVANSQNRMYFTYNGGQIFQVVGPIRDAPDAPTAAAAEQGPAAAAKR